MGRERDIDLVEEEAPSDAEVDELVEQEHAGSILAFLGGVVVGALVGAGIALLLAPESGDLTRRRVRRKLDELKEGAREHFDEARDQVEDWRDDAHRELRRRRRRLSRRLKGRA